MLALELRAELVVPAPLGASAALQTLDQAPAPDQLRLPAPERIVQAVALPPQVHQAALAAPQFGPRPPRSCHAGDPDRHPHNGPCDAHRSLHPLHLGLPYPPLRAPTPAETFRPPEV